MAAAGEEDLVAWVREVRGAEHFQADCAVLEEARTFLWNNAAESTRTATHLVLESFPDWWARNRRAPPGLDIRTSADAKELYRHAGNLFDLGIPLTLAERRTPLFRFFQDVEAWGTRDVTLSVEDLMGPDNALTRLVGTFMSETFPNHGGFLDAAVYDATGLSQTKGVRKTSLRLVWPGVVVDSDRAARVRDLLVHRLTGESAEGGPIADLEAQLRERSPGNAWHSVFGDAAYGSRANVRMPLNDRVSPLPLRAPERRPFVPVGVLRFTFSGEGKMKAEWLCRRAELDSSEWIKIGCLTQLHPDAQLTEWTVPAYPTNQPIPTSSTRTGRVKVRTAGGSPGGGGESKRALKVPAPERAGQLLTVERSFSGSSEQFCERMEQHMGKATLEPDGSLVWKQPNGEARIVMYDDDKRVKVIGRPNPVRSLVVIIAPFTKAFGQGFGQHMPDGRVPSEAYAPMPPAAGAVDEGDRAARADNPNTADAAAEGGVETLAGCYRVAGQDFTPEGQGELALQEGDAICITHDPEGEHDGSQDRWVYGRNEATSQVGWFPLSHTTHCEQQANN